MNEDLGINDVLIENLGKSFKDKKEKKMKKLNLGSGGEYHKGWINVDINPKQKPDIVWDLNKFPYPFKDNEFSIIRLSHVLEHLNNPIKVLEELHRVSKDKCEIHINVPYDKHTWGAWGEITHLRPYNSRTFKPLFSKTHNYNFKFDNLQMSFRVICKRWWIQPLVKLSNLLININLTLTEYFWSRYIPIMELRVILRVKK